MCECPRRRSYQNNSQDDKRKLNKVKGYDERNLRIRVETYQRAYDITAKIRRSWTFFDNGGNPGWRIYEIFLIYLALYRFTTNLLLLIIPSYICNGVGKWRSCNLDGSLDRFEPHSSNRRFLSLSLSRILPIPIDPPLPDDRFSNIIYLYHEHTLRFT